jgi:FKBP-type peptidyl-prolyl cis-trans isomerase
MEKTEDIDFSVDIEDRVKRADNHVIIGLDSVVHYFTFQHGVILKDSLTRLATKLMDGRKPRFKVAFITNLSWAISSQTLEVQKVINETKTLLHEEFSDEDGDSQNISSLLTTSKRTDSNPIIVIALFAYKAKSDEIEVIGAGLGTFKNKVGGYVAYLATKEDVYSKSKYGKSADTESFLGRGIAKFVLSMFQFVTYWRSYKSCKHIFLHCNKDKVPLFQHYGFVEADMTDKKQWTSSVKTLHASVGISNSDVRLFDHHAMTIDVAIHGSLDKTIRLSLSASSQPSAPPGGPSKKSTKAAMIMDREITADRRIPRRRNEKTSTAVAAALAMLSAQASASVGKQPSTATTAQSQSSDPNSTSDKAKEQPSSTTTVQSQPSDTSEKDKMKKKSSERDLKNQSKKVGQTETELSPAIERIVNGVFKKHPQATLLQLRHHIEMKYNGTLSDSQWDLVKAKLSELADTGETELSTSLKTLMDEAFHESSEEADEEDIREILESKYGRMLPDRIFLVWWFPFSMTLMRGCEILPTLKYRRKQ